MSLSIELACDKTAKQELPFMRERNTQVKDPTKALVKFVWTVGGTSTNSKKYKEATLLKLGYPQTPTKLRVDIRCTEMISMSCFAYDIRHIINYIRWCVSIRDKNGRFDFLSKDTNRHPVTLLKSFSHSFSPSFVKVM
jgi:hypothetical protein